MRDGRFDSERERKERNDESLEDVESDIDGSEVDEIPDAPGMVEYGVECEHR